MMNKCPYCDKQISANTEICPKCKAEIPKEKQNKEEKNGKGK